MSATCIAKLATVRLISKLFYKATMGSNRTKMNNSDSIILIKLKGSVLS